MGGFVDEVVRSIRDRLLYGTKIRKDATKEAEEAVDYPEGSPVSELKSKQSTTDPSAPDQLPVETSKSGGFRKAARV